MDEFRVNDVDLQEFLHSFTDGDGKLPSDFEQLKTEGHYLIHGDAERRFCLKERDIYLKTLWKTSWQSQSAFSQICPYPMQSM